MRSCLFTVVALLAAANCLAADPIKDIGPVGKVELVKDNFQFLEGPTRTPDGSLYFTDIPAETIYQLSPEGAIEVFLKPSKKANGLMYGAAANCWLAK